MRTEDTIKGLWNLARTPARNGENEVQETRAIEVLDALLTSGDLALIELIPILLSLFVQSGFSVNLAPLFYRYGVESQQSDKLEKFLLITLSLLKEENLPLPTGSIEQETLLKKRWGDLVSSHVLELGNGISLQINRLREVFRRYASQPLQSLSVRAKEEHGAVTPSSPQIHRHLRLLFSPKQEELILKKLNGEPLTKTEREYYSRIVKKKLKALTDKDLQKLASRLIKH